MHHENKHIFLHAIEYFNLNWKIFALFLALTLFGAGFNISNHPIYTASAKITAKKSDSSPLQAMSAQMSGMGLGGGDKGLKREMLVFESHTFYAELARILGELPNSNLIKAHVADGNRKLFNINYFYKKIMAKLSEKMFLELSKETHNDFAQNLRSVLSIHTKSSFLIEFSTKTSDPATSVLVTNRAVKLAILEIGDRDVKELDTARNFLKIQLAEVGDRIEVIEQEIVTHTKKVRSLSIEQIEGEIGEKNIGLHRQLVQFGVKIKHNERRIKEILKLKKWDLSKGKSLNAGSMDYSKFSYNSKVFRLRKENSLYKTRMETIRPLVAKYAKRQESIPKTEQMLFSFKKKLGLEYLTFNQLKRQILNMDMQNMSIRSRISEVEPALISSVVPFMSKSFQVGMAILIALACAGLLIFVLETLDPNVKRQSDLEAFGMVYLGAITDFSKRRSLKRTIRFLKEKFVKRRNGANVMVDHRSAESICFRYLRSRILYQRRAANQKSQVLVFVSPQSGEGKTFLSFNLSKTISLAKKKVLVVDCDFLKGSLSSSYGFPSQDGVTNYLASNSSSVEDAHGLIQEVTPNLKILPAGSMAEESLESFCDKKFGEMIESLRPMYDYIILDTPGILPVAEAVDIIKFGDLILMCVVRGRSQLEYVKRAIERILHVTDCPMGFIFNRYSDSHESEYGYYYRRYSYGESKLKMAAVNKDDQDDLIKSA